MSAIAFKTLGGHGADLVLIHGFGSDRMSWAGTSPALMEVARVHALDLPGHGDSLGAAAGNSSPAALARVIADTLSAQGIARAHLLGHSLGGGIAMLMAQAAPQRVASLTLLAPAGLGQQVDLDFLSRFPELAGTEETAALLQTLVSKPLLINRFTIARVIEQLARPGARETLRAIAQGLAESGTTLQAAAANIAASNLPRLVIFGGADRINPPDEAALARFGGRNVIIPDAGHLPHVEAARLVNAEIASFISSSGG